MRKYFFGLAILVLALTTSCNFTEEIHLNADGSGKVSVQLDGSELMKMGDEAPNPEEAVDSIISFAKLLREKKDSIAALPVEEQEKLKQLEPYEMRIKIDPVEQSMLFSMNRDFISIEEIEDSFENFQKMSAMDKSNASNENPMEDLGIQGSKVSYSFKDKHFSRRTIIVDSSLYKKQLDSLDSAAMFLSGSSYTLKVHFPSRVTKVSDEEVSFSMDGKTLIKEVNFMDLIRNPDLLNLEVDLED